MYRNHFWWVHAFGARIELREGTDGTGVLGVPLLMGPEDAHRFYRVRALGP